MLKEGPSQSTQINVRLTRDDVKMLNAVAKRLGESSASAVIRMLIAQAFHEGEKGIRHA